MGGNGSSRARLLVPFAASLVLRSAYAATITSAAPFSLITAVNFVGYTEYGSSWSANFCPADSTWYQTSTWGRCCPTTVAGSDCGIWTTCLDRSVIIQEGGRNATCSSDNSVCRTAVISQDATDSHPFLYVGCGTGNWTALRTPPIAAVRTITSVASQTESNVIPTTAPPSRTAASTPSNTGSTTTGGEAAQTSGSKSEKGSSSKGWIAGAVIGPLAVAVIAGLLFYIWRLKKSKKPDPSAAPMMGTQPAFAQEGQAYYPQNAYAQTAYGGYQQPYDPSQQNFAGANKMPFYAGQGMPQTPVEIGSTPMHQTPVEVAAEPIQHGAHQGPK
ncbi:hypothetical protein BCR34DRAFT_607119 [Clohesyomyces aquaticus]|uniref:Mid2 domain-containing protein n=1 Tax=Clohesyomyces aquaticus TaxID=1231657 RepID=A0A1Y1YII3_9PLEO|nr:hypothetical protein BCR34DRAFT_607119 [Clohesyomyces aquaticus]